MLYFVIVIGGGGGDRVVSMLFLLLLGVKFTPGRNRAVIVTFIRSQS